MFDWVVLSRTFHFVLSTVVPVKSSKNTVRVHPEGSVGPVVVGGGATGGGVVAAARRAVRSATCADRDSLSAVSAVTDICAPVRRVVRSAIWASAAARSGVTSETRDMVEPSVRT